MPRMSPIVSLDKALSELLRRRAEHQAALTEIDGIFAKYGINPVGSKAATKPAVVTAIQPSPKKRRKRNRFAQTAEQFVLELLKGKTLTSGQINSAWGEAGRNGKADNTLTLLTKKKALKRTPVKDGRGSNYSVA